MRFKMMLDRLGSAGGSTSVAVFAALALAVGLGVMPLFIYFAGTSALGRYEGASLPRMYQGIYQGLQSGSLASWIVVLGPLGLYLAFLGLRLWWRASARLA